MKAREDVERGSVERDRVEWRAAPVPDAAQTLRDDGAPRHLAELLARRGVSTPAEARAFLNPDLGQLHDPRCLAGMDEAVERLLRARKAGERVAIVGDYDVDGVSGTALLTAVLRACQMEVTPILPHRLRDGYGFQPVHVERARAAGCAVVVTVDCGTTSHTAAGAALDAGLDVIVTDHHLPDAALPDAVVQINPRQAGCSYPFEELSGAGLAFKLALAFARACERPVDPRVLLRIACLGTIADLVPLEDENRVIAALGLFELGRTRSPGLRALMRTARLTPPLSTADIGYRIGPRLNAPGRLDAADAALELLLTRDPHRSSVLAEQLDRWNRERQDWEKRVAAEAREMFLERGELPALLVGWSPSWHRGVVGIAAGRLAREFNRPTLLLAVDDGTAAGSGRSIAGIHLYDFLAQWKSELPRFGGHAQAIGLTVEAGALPDLRRRWEDAAARTWADTVAVRRYEYELELAARDVHPAFHAELRRLEPHGQGNPQPLIRVRGPLRLARAPRLFGQGHLSAEAVGPNGGRVRMLGWGWAKSVRSLSDGDFEVLGYLEDDRYRGGAVLRLLDSRPARED